MTRSLSFPSQTSIDVNAERTLRRALLHGRPDETQVSRPALKSAHSGHRK